MTGFLETIALKGFEVIFGNLVSEYTKSQRHSLSVSNEDFKRDLKNHFEVVFGKCIKIKTILNDDTPVPLLSIYVDQTFKLEDKCLDQYDVIEHIRDNNSCVISGNGGGGKSIFVRYLWLSYFEKSDGKIPFFLELRQLNPAKHAKFEDFIFRTIIDTGSKISRADFARALKSGEFIFFLDGFDEINYDLRAEYEQNIIDMKKNNPNLTMIVTSRPDQRFGGWQQFDTVRVQPLDELQVIELIKKTEFNNPAKTTLLKRIEDGLFKTHESFLSNPLLACMMLITIHYSPAISQSMFQFYEHAFDALYYRHDQTKDNFQRKLHCTIDRNSFMRLMAFFCLKSYLQERYEFSQNELHELCSNTIDVEGIDISVEDFIKDMTESFCILKREGLDHSFTHRSFQEYFSAYCISRVASKNLVEIFNRLANRHSDQVLDMIYEIDSYLFREKYFFPVYRKFGSFFNRKSGRDIELTLMRLTNLQFSFQRLSSIMPAENRKYKGRLISVANTSGEFDALSRISLRLGSSRGFTRIAVTPPFKASRDRNFDQWVIDRFDSNNEAEEITVKLEDGNLVVLEDDNPVNDNDVLALFKGSKHFSNLRTDALEIQNFIVNEISAFHSVSDSLDDFI